jgi:peptidoglycan lytic transglycosylase
LLGLGLEVPKFTAEKSVKSALLSIAAVLLSEASSYGYPQRTPDDFGHSRANVTPNKAVIIGRASWYGRAAAGQKTATGERLDPNKLTAACSQLPLQSRAVVTNLENGRSVGVRIDDCGPYTRGRQIDVSKRAAESLDMAYSRLLRLHLTILSQILNLLGTAMIFCTVVYLDRTTRCS